MKRIITSLLASVAVHDAPTHPNAVDVRLPSPAFHAAFASAISGGLASGKAGVNNCALSFGHPVRVANMVGQPWPPISGSPDAPGALVTAGPTPLMSKMQARQPAAGPVVPVQRAGLTVLQRAGVRRKGTVAFIQPAAPAVTPTLLIPAGLPGSSTSDTFVGASATPGSSVFAVEVRVLDAATGAVIPAAVDDLAFGVN